MVTGLLLGTLEQSSGTQAWLSFITSLIWELIVVVFLLVNRKHIV
jgi:hypothetical protein